MTRSSKQGFEQLRGLPSQLETCVNDLLSQRIQVVEFRAQLNAAQCLWRELNDEPNQQELAGGLSEATTLNGARWPKRLQQAVEELQLALDRLERFWQDGRLSDLDQAVVKLRASDFAMREALGPIQTKSLHVEPPQNLKVQRWNQITRAVFSCAHCGWELGYSREIEADEFLDVELEQFECPLCAKP